MPSLNHMGLTVADIDRSIEFYRDVVGMQLYSRLQMQGEWFDTLTHNSGAEIDVAMLRLDSFTLQLVQYLAAAGATLPLGHNNAGNPHLCINVDDVEAKHREAIGRGGLDPTPIVEIAASGSRSFYVRDPDGLPVEFLQRPV